MWGDSWIQGLYDHEEQSLRQLLFCPCNFQGDVSMYVKGLLMLDCWNKTGNVSSENSNRSKETNLLNCRALMTVIYNESCLQAFHSLIIDWSKPFHLGRVDAATEFSSQESSVCYIKYEQYHYRWVILTLAPKKLQDFFQLKAQST